MVLVAFVELSDCWLFTTHTEKLLASIAHLPARSLDITNAAYFHSRFSRFLQNMILFAFQIIIPGEIFKAFFGVGQMLIALLADIKVAGHIGIDPILHQRRTHGAYIAHRTSGAGLIKLVLVPIGTALLGTGRFPALHTIHLLTLQAYRAAGAPLSALLADGLGEFVEAAHEELQGVLF